MAQPEAVRGFRPHAEKLSSGEHVERGLRYFPIALFSLVMGIAGVTIATHRTETLFDVPHILSGTLLTLASAFFVVFTLLQIVRAIRWPEEIVRDFNHPTRINFFAAFSVSFLLLSIAYLDFVPDIARVLWWIGTPLHLGITLAILNKLIHQDTFEIQHYNPAWFIPFVGNIVVPISGVEFAPLGVNVFFFGVGLFFSIVFSTIFFYRIFFHAPLPIKLVPTFFILMAPPAVGCISYVKLTGCFDIFAQILYSIALFMALLFLFQFRMYTRIPFYISWWAYLFPSAALTIATILAYNMTNQEVFRWLAHFFNVVLLTWLAFFTWKTYKLLKMRHLCVKED